MTTTDNSRRAVIAMHPTLPGAIAYINAERAETPVGQQVIENWLEQGLKVAKVTLAEAMAQLSLHNATQQALAIKPPPDRHVNFGDAQEIPMMLRRQAD
jgi:hypothetical protein